MFVRDHKLWGHWHKLSPNHSSAGTIVPRFLVLHYTAGWDGAQTRDFFMSRAARVSAHLVIDRSGEVWQLVPFNRRAWHAGRSRHGGYTDLNAHSIGIELDNPGFLRPLGGGRYADWAFHDVPPERLAGYELIEAPHPRIGSGTYAWARYTEAQLAALDEVVAVLLDAYPTLQEIVSHEEIDARGWKTDPGPAFPMQRYDKLLDDRADGEDASPGTLLEVTASALNVRGGPGTDFDTMAFGPLTAGARVAGISRSGAWWEILTEDGQRGWVHGAYVRYA